MRLYQTTTEFNCGVDLHARQMYVCVVDREGTVLVHRNIKDNDFEFFLKLVAPYRHSLTVCSECCFCWYWLADACAEAGIAFVLAHALYLRSIQADKKKNDRVDSEKIAHLLRTNMIPYAYVYPRGMRPLRTLLRRRMAYVWQRAQLVGWQTCTIVDDDIWLKPADNLEEVFRVPIFCRAAQSVKPDYIDLAIVAAKLTQLSMQVLDIAGVVLGAVIRVMPIDRRIIEAEL